MEHVLTNEAPTHVTFLAQGIKANGFLFTAAVPRTPGSHEIPDSFEEQAHLAFQNLTAVVNAAGCQMKDLVKLIVYLSDIGNWARMNEVYGQYVNLDAPPVRVACEPANLNAGYTIELDAMVLVRD